MLAFVFEDMYLKMNMTNPPKAPTEAKKINLEETLKHPGDFEVVDHSFVVIDSHLWIMHATVLVLMASLLLWSIFGSLSIKIQGRGIFIDKQGLYEVQAKTTGIVQNLPIKQGSVLKQGEVIAELMDPQLDLKIKLTEAHIKSLSDKADQPTEKDALEHEEQNLLFLKLAKEFATIKAPFDSDVVEVLVNQGDSLAIGAPIAVLEHRQLERGGPLLVVYGFVPIDIGKKLRPGMEVQMELTNVRAEEYGKMLGTVREISEYAVSPERLAKLIPNQTLVNYLLQDNKASIQLIIDPKIDPATNSGYRWTTRDGPPISISSGSVCTIVAIVEKLRPIYFIFPMDKFREILYFRKVVGTEEPERRK